MKCEICHKADAAKAIRRGDGDDDELYVCEACAKAERQRRQKKSQRTRKVTGLPPGMSMSVTRITSSDDDGTGEPPPIIGAIMNAFQDMVSDIEKAEKEAKESAKKPELSDLDLDGIDGTFLMRGHLHLEGLHLIGELDAAKRALHAVGMELAGIDADGVSDAGHAYSVRFAKDDDKKARRIASALLREERNARVRLFEEMTRVFGDALCRALAILKNCRLLSPAEQFDLLSPMRLAAIENMLDGMKLADVEKMISKIDLSSGEDRMNQDERDKADAERADAMNGMFEDVVLNERAEEKFL